MNNPDSSKHDSLFAEVSLENVLRKATLETIRYAISVAPDTVKYILRQKVAKDLNINVQQLEKS